MITVHDLTVTIDKKYDNLYVKTFKFENRNKTYEEAELKTYSELSVLLYFLMQFEPTPNTSIEVII